MFSALLRVHSLAFLFAFFLFFGPSAVSFAAENPARVEIRLEQLSPATGDAKVFGPPGLASAEASTLARAYDFTTLQISKVKFATVLFAPEARADEPSVGPADPSDLAKLLEAIGGAKGAGAMGIALVVTQVLLMIAKALWNPSGGWQLTLVSGLSLASGVLFLMVIGKLDLGAALMHSTTLAAIQVFLNQILKKATAPA